MICNICPRRCGADRTVCSGFCGEGEEIRIARAALHFWEEPIISGRCGSGAVFFSGCNLRCVYCQNRFLARGECGTVVSTDRLADIFLRLQDDGAHNINLVTATHFTPFVARAIEKARISGLCIPVVWNSSAYEDTESLRALCGLVDVYLPDFKYATADAAQKYSAAKDYPDIAMAAICEMYRQVGKVEISNDLIKKGVIIRHLVLPNNIIASKMALKRLFKHFENNVYYSIMRQYTPMWDNLPSELRRTVTDAEYKSVTDYALDLGIKNGFFQCGEAAKESFVPLFDGTGV